MSLTIKEILKMPEMEGMVVLAGHQGIDRIVNSTTVLDAPDGIKWLKGKELALTSTYPFLNSKERLDILIQDLAIRNVSGLGLKLDRYVRELPPLMLEAANKYHFPIISLPHEKAWVDLMNPIMSEILNLKTRRLIRSEEINKSFTKVLLSDANVESIAELLHHYMDNPVTINILSEKIKITFPKIHERGNGMDTEDHLISTAEKEVIDPEHGVYRIKLLEESYIQVPLDWKGLGTEGFILIKETNQQVDVEDIDCLIHAKNALSIKTIQLKAIKEFDRKYRNDFVLDLLYGEISEDITEIKRKAWELNYTLSEYYYLVILNVFTDSMDMHYQFIDEIQDNFFLSENTIIGLDKEKQLIFLFPYKEKIKNEMLKNEIYSVISRLQQRFGIFSWSVGISQVCAFNSLKDAYQQAVKAMYHGIDMVGKEHIQFFDDLGIYRLFSHPALHDEIEQYVHELLQPLIFYDEEHNSDLVKTLRVFLENGGNYRKTAQSLFIHHNTVRYRLQVINQISNFDIHQQNVQLQFQIAFLLLPIIHQSS